MEEAENYISNRADDIELGLDGEGYDINNEIENEIKNLQNIHCFEIFLNKKWQI